MLRLHKNCVILYEKNDHMIILLVVATPLSYAMRTKH